MLKIVVNCGPCEEYIGPCLASVQSQDYRDWEAFVTVDPCGDNTFEVAVVAAAGDHRIHIHRNTERLFSMTNLIRAIEHSGTNPEDIIVVLDGDDRFANIRALSTIAAKYEQTDCWMTYGSWVTDWPNPLGIRDGMWPGYPEGTADFRAAEWRGTAVRTWKRWLWNRIDDRDFRDAAGNYLRVTEDQACMLPMLEMSGTAKAKHIADVLMIYNRSSPHGCAFTRREEMLANSRYLRTLPSYSRLLEKPVAAICASAL